MILPTLLSMAGGTLLGQSTGVLGGFGGGLPAYDGPAILGRSGTTTGSRGGESVPIHVQATVNGTYNSNLAAFSVDSQGRIVQSGSIGTSAGFGASGQKLFRRAIVAIDYSANYTRYLRSSLFNGSNHQLSLHAAKQLTGKWQIQTQLAAGTSNQFLGGQGVFQASEFEFLSAPVGELFDSRTHFFGNSTGVVYAINRRQSVRMTGNASTVRRRAQGLVDFQSYGAAGDWVYRLSRRASMGVSYQFGHYDFTKIFGESDVQTIGWHLSRTFGRDWNVAGSLTGAKQSTVGVRDFALDPVISAILGRTTGREVFESNNLIYGYTLNVSRRIRRSSATFFATRGINPGNGFFLTAITVSTGASFHHNLNRDIALMASVSHNKITSLGFASGAFDSKSAGGGIGYKISDSFGLNVSADYRTFDLQQSTFGRTGSSVSIGLSYYPQKGIASIF